VPMRSRSLRTARRPRVAEIASLDRMAISSLGMRQ
jgi:hypothetical protein